jgi:ATP synthase protein I
MLHVTKCCSSKDIQTRLLNISQYINGYKQALKLVYFQLVTVFFVGALGLLISVLVSLWLMIGGLISIFANCWMIFVVFRPQVGAPLGKMLGAFYWGQIGKFTITALLFLAAFKQCSLFVAKDYALALLLGYLITLSVVWIYPLILGNHLVKFKLSYWKK